MYCIGPKITSCGRLIPIYVESDRAYTHANTNVIKHIKKNAVVQHGFHSKEFIHIQRKPDIYAIF